MANDSSQSLLPAYLVVGTDGLKRDKVLERLEARLDPGFVDFNLERLELSANLTGADLVSSLQSFPFGGGFRLVELRDASSLNKDVSEAIVSYLDDPNPTSVLCLVADSLAKNTRLYKAVAKLGKNAIISCESLKGQKLVPFVQKLAASMGRRMDVSAAKEFQSRVGDSTVYLERQLRSLVDVLGDKVDITLADVEEYVERVAEIMWWDVVDAVADRNAAEALSLYKKMADPPYVLLQIKLAERYRDLIRIRSLLSKGRSSEVTSAYGWKGKILMRSARLYSDGECERALCELVKLEQAIKGSADEDVAFVRFVEGVARR